MTNEPGLSVTLVEGVSMAKALSVSLVLCWVSITSKGIFAHSLSKKKRFPMDVLLVSGGHTQLLHVKNLRKIRFLFPRWMTALVRVLTK